MGSSLQVENCGGSSFLAVNDQGSPRAFMSNVLVILSPDGNQRSCFTEEN